MEGPPVRRQRAGGEEQDAFSRYWRKYLRWKPGQLRKVKRRSAKRERRTAARQIREQEGTPGE